MYLHASHTSLGHFSIITFTMCKFFFFAYKEELVHKLAMINVPYSIIIAPRSLRGSSPSSASNGPVGPKVTSPRFS